MLGAAFRITMSSAHEDSLFWGVTLKGDDVTQE